VIDCSVKIQVTSKSVSNRIIYFKARTFPQLWY